MSHVHIPDGVIPLGWSLVWFALALIWLGLSLYMLRREDKSRLVPRVGIFAAVMILSMSVEWFGVYHLNLTVLSGIALGPWAGFMAQFLTNLMLSLLGHGGITTLGLNSLILGSEVVAGCLLFRLFKQVRGGRGRAGRRGWASSSASAASRFAVPAFWATFITLAFSFALMVGAVRLSLGDATAALGTLLQHHEVHHGAQHDAEPTAQHDAQHKVRGDSFSVANFVKVMVVPGVIGWLAEALIVSGLIGYIGRVRPGFFQRN